MTGYKGKHDERDSRSFDLPIFEPEVDLYQQTPTPHYDPSDPLGDDPLKRVDVIAGATIDPTLLGTQGLYVKDLLTPDELDDLNY